MRSIHGETKDEGMTSSATQVTGADYNKSHLVCLDNVPSDMMIFEKARPSSAVDIQTAVQQFIESGYR